MEYFWGILIGIAIAVLIAVSLLLFVPAIKEKLSSKKAEKILKDAEVKSSQIVKNAQIDAKQVVYELKQEAERDIKERKQEVQSLENKQYQREQAIDKRDAALLHRETAMEEKLNQIEKRKEELNQKNQMVQARIDGLILELERVSQLSINEARAELFKNVEAKISNELSTFIKNKEDEARDTAEVKARDILTLAMSKYAQEVTTERTVSVVTLPNDEMKGRIIGLQGRNIRSLEQHLGVDLIIDDTPEVISVSCFDPIRREIARRTLEYLVKDGRIQPKRIEELAQKAKDEVTEITRKAGEDAAFKLGLPRINKELLEYVGKLKYRTSYGQNAYAHSMEVAYLTGIMAEELGLDVHIARRAGLLHDIGKAVDHEREGSHVELGVELAKKYDESNIIVNAIASHHGDVKPSNPYSVLVDAADTLSAARPGARSETLETYIKRLEQLEEIVKHFQGIQQTYAMQSGREVRVMVMPDKIDDLGAFKLAREIKEKIEKEMTYPGQIKVQVIREYRAVETAK
ncbi:MAG: ribonuclease Y [Erysipelotrichaceae bacterium]|jgi:ribonuclease Y|nr:ribonuclease Y [Erysipelotrichaceae bacterium]